MKTTRAIFLTVLAAAVLLAAWYFWRPSTVPSGQQELLTLSSANFSEFEKAFNTQSDRPRVVLLLSPT